MTKRRRARSKEEPWGQEKASLELARDAVNPPAGGWIRAVREWRGTRQKDLAAQLGTKRQAWAQLELSEQRDAISLYSLRKAARALDCDVVYYLVPRAVAEAPAGTDAKPADAVAVAPASGTAPSKPAEKPADSGWFNDDLRTELL
jgi:transcriptional regulator with XRE-family HTH domain